MKNKLFFLMLITISICISDRFSNYLPATELCDRVIECYNETEAASLKSKVTAGFEIQIEEDNNQWKYQCIDLVKHLRKDLINRSFGGYAYNFWDLAQNYGLEKGNDPVKGAVLIWKKGKNRAKYGHVAVVTEVNPDGTFDIIEQNWKINSKDEGIISLREKILLDSNIMYGFVYDNPNKIECQASVTGLATALVIDRSGSMKGEKLKKALEAAKTYIITVNTDDLASVSVFSDNASTEIQMERQAHITGKLDSVFSKIGATNATNVGAGLDQGYKQLDKVTTKGKVSLLLSDGINNRGDWRSIVQKFKSKNWPIYTVGFGKDADEKTLKEIATLTGGTYRPAETVDVVNVYHEISAHAQNKSVLLSVSEPLAPTGKLNYQVPVSDEAKVLNVFSNWQGSRLKTLLISPIGESITGVDLTGNAGRYAEGKVFQMMEVNNPSLGRWKIELSWAEPPASTEQVNVSVSEKSDIFANILGFRSQYALGEKVIINVQAAEVVGERDRIPLRNVTVSVQIQKPGPKMIRMVQAQSRNWSMYKDVKLNITRDISLFDDGSHDDYNAGDCIFGNTFTETDKNGAYLVTAVIKGQKQNRQQIEKILQGSFQVGPISKNMVTTSQTLNYMLKAKNHIDNNTPYKKETLSKPIKEIEKLKSDPLDNINKLLKGKK